MAPASFAALIEVSRSKRSPNGHRPTAISSKHGQPHTCNYCVADQPKETTTTATTIAIAVAVVLVVVGCCCVVVVVVFVCLFVV